MEEFIPRKTDAETGKKRFEKLDINKDGCVGRDEFMNVGVKTK